MNYKRLSIDDREKIHILINQGKSNGMIAEELDRSHSIIAGELSRFKARFEYSPSKAHELASRLKSKTGKAIS
jgi:IS30 family transposase